jgi:hypothetical protein
MQMLGYCRVSSIVFIFSAAQGLSRKLPPEVQVLHSLLLCDSGFALLFPPVATLVLVAGAAGILGGGLSDSFMCAS